MHAQLSDGTRDLNFIKCTGLYNLKPYLCPAVEIPSRMGKGAILKTFFLTKLLFQLPKSMFSIGKLHIGIKNIKSHWTNHHFKNIVFGDLCGVHLPCRLKSMGGNGGAIILNLNFHSVIRICYIH